MVADACLKQRLLLVPLILLIVIIGGGLLKVIIGGTDETHTVPQIFERGFFAPRGSLPPIRLRFVTLLLIFLVFDLEIVLLTGFVLCRLSGFLAKFFVILFILGSLFWEMAQGKLL